MSLVVIPSEQESASQFFNTINNIVDRKEKRQERMIEIMRQTGDYKGLEKEGVRTKIDNPLYVDPGPMPDQQKDPKGYDAWLKRVQAAGPAQIEGDFRRQSATLYEMGYSQIRQAMAEGRLDDARMIRDKTAAAIAQSAELWRTKPSENLMDNLLKVAPSGPAKKTLVNVGTKYGGKSQQYETPYPIGSKAAWDDINRQRAEQGLDAISVEDQRMMTKGSAEGTEKYVEQLDRQEDAKKGLEAGLNSSDPLERQAAARQAKREGLTINEGIKIPKKIPFIGGKRLTDRSLKGSSSDASYRFRQLGQN